MSKILVIDDEEALRTILRAILEDVGYDVLDAADGEKGLNILRRHQVDVVITDILMPEKDGLETIQEVKKIHPTTKIIAMSGRDKGSDLSFLAFARKFGADRVLTKPFSGKELLSVLSNILLSRPA